MGHLKNNQQRKRRRYLISRNTGKSIKSRIQNFLSMCLGGYTYYSSNAYKVFDSEKNSLGEQKFIAEMVFIHEAKQRVVQLMQRILWIILLTSLFLEKIGLAITFLLFFLVQTLLQSNLSQHETLRVYQVRQIPHNGNRCLLSNISNNTKLQKISSLYF